MAQHPRSSRRSSTPTGRPDSLVSGNHAAAENLTRPVALLQITLIVRDLAAAVRDFETHLGLSVAFRDPGVAEWGLENAVLPLGTTFIELLSPLPSLPPERTPGGRHLARQGGDGGYMVILRVEDLSAWRKPLEDSNVRIAWEGETSGTAHGAAWAGFHLHPQDTGGMMISLDRPDPPDSWAGAGPDWRRFVRQDIVDDLVGIELESPEPARLASRWAAVLGRPLTADGRLLLDRGDLAFVDAQVQAGGEGRERLAAVSLHAVDRNRAGESLMLGGVSFRLV